MSDVAIEVVGKHTCLLAEGPVWDDKKNTICWVDIPDGNIHEYSHQYDIHKVISVKQMIGSFAICDNGDFIAALQNGFAIVDRINGDIKMLGDPESNLSNNRFNEGKCDPAGRFWAGTMSLSEDKHAGSLYALEKDFGFTRKIADVTISNGMAWSADHKVFYYIDTPTFEVVAFDYDAASGAIRNRRVIITIERQDGYPDGMTIDNQGMLWIAHWDGWQITRWNPNNGKKLHTIALPVARVTSCTFGGPSLKDLYITSAKVGLQEDDLKKQPLAGSLFVLRNCGFKGTAAFEFKT